MGPSAPPAQFRSPLDAIGATASFACAVHCAIVAIFLGVAPAVSFLASSWVEWAFLLTSAAIGVAALVPGYRLHRQRRPLVLFGVGMATLLMLRLLHAAPSVSEMIAVALAAACLISAHWINHFVRIHLHSADGLCSGQLQRAGIAIEHHAVVNRQRGIE
jgi:MerC mercury resistance protein